jgi:hypothetical protein
MEPTKDEDEDMEEDDEVKEEPTASFVDHPEVPTFLQAELLVRSDCVDHASHRRKAHEALHATAFCLVALEAWSARVEREIWVCVEG